jgi:hypothetical protein
MGTETNDRTTRTRRGRAVLLGVGLDDADGHFRATTGDGYRLLGGSEQAHAAMRRRVHWILAELERRGYRLDAMTRDEADEVTTLLATMPRPDTPE